MSKDNKLFPRIRSWTRTLDFQIWRTVALVLLVFLVCLMFLNHVLLASAKREFLYSQMEEAAEARRTFDSEEREGATGEDRPAKETAASAAGTTYINHFLLLPDESGWRIQVDRFTQRSYMTAAGERPVLDAIVTRITEAVSRANGQALRASDRKGRVPLGGAWHYYYVDETRGDGSFMVYLASAERQRPDLSAYLVASLITLAAGLYASRRMSRRIARPIGALERFADEVAHRRWDVTAPVSSIEEVRQLSAALTRMKEMLRTTEERERQFLQAGSHNLKTPVMTIKGYAQALLDGVDVGTERSAAEVIRREADVLERRILQLLRIQTYGHALEARSRQDEVRLDRLLNNLVGKFRMVRPDLAWELSLTELEILCNADALQTAFENLFENGIRYAAHAFSVRMAVEACIRIEFANDGPPFSVENPDALFERYRKDRDGRFGLGLAIVRQIIEGHGGRIAARNVPQGGVLFVVELPVARMAIIGEAEADPLA